MFHQRTKVSLLFTGLFVCTMLTGCQQPTTGGLTGKVLLDGKPMTSGRVMAANANGRTGTGSIAADGSYDLKQRSGEGLEPGQYDLWVIAYEGSSAADPEANADLAIPAKYASQTTAGFQTTVVAGETAKYDLELTTN